MDLKTAFEFVEYLQNKKVEDRSFQRWVAGPQFSVSFDEFQRSLTPPKPMKSDEEILAEVQKAYEKAGIK